MKYAFFLCMVIALVVPVEASFQTNTEGDYRIILTTTPDQPVVYEPTHMELHIQNVETGDTVKDLEVECLILHMDEYIGVEPHTSENNLSEIHPDIKQRTLLTMKSNADEPPGHYHENHTFNDTGLYEVIVHFEKGGEKVFSVFSQSVQLEEAENEREPLKLRYSLFTIIGASFAIIGAVIYAIRKILDIYEVK